MLKLTIYTAILLTAFLQAAVATEDNDLSSNKPISDKSLLVTDMYASLYSAIEMDSADEVKQFIAFGADINHRYEDDITPIMLASSMGSVDVVHTLIKLGANPNLLSKRELTAIDYANKNSNQLIITALENIIYSEEADSEITLIKKIQFLLGRLGYDTGEVDGVYGERTKQSLKTFSLNTKQDHHIEISKRQVESLKNVFFKQDLIEVPAVSKKNTNNIFEKSTEEEISVIESIPLDAHPKSFPEN